MGQATIEEVPMRESLEHKLGFAIENKWLLREAMVSGAYKAEHQDSEPVSNERLEVKGRAFMKLFVAEYLFRNLPEREGGMTKLRSALTDWKMLVQVADELGLEEHIVMGSDEKRDSIVNRQRSKAIALRALVGAIYQDRGCETARQFVVENIISHLDEAREKPPGQTAADRFKCEAERRMGLVPEYRLNGKRNTGKKKRIVVELCLGGSVVAEGEGKRRSAAERSAARKGLRAMGWD